METHHITPARGLSETGLKWVALVTMVLDHIHYFFSFTGCERKLDKLHGSLYGRVRVSDRWSGRVQTIRKRRIPIRLRKV